MVVAALQGAWHDASVFAAENEPMLTPQRVISAYELVLGRQPESNEVVRHHVENTATSEELEHRLITSEEFFQRFASDEKMQTVLLASLRSTKPMPARFALSRVGVGLRS